MNIDGDEITAGTGDSFAGDLFLRFRQEHSGKTTRTIPPPPRSLSRLTHSIFSLPVPFPHLILTAGWLNSSPHFPKITFFSIDASLTERPTARLAETIRSVSEVSDRHKCGDHRIYRRICGNTRNLRAVII